MAGSTFGTIFRITTWGESHGEGVGVIVDGVPSGIPLEQNDIQEMLDKRRPGQSQYTTPRNETDTVSILSGVFEGKTTGTPISLFVKNKTQRSKDYSEIASYYRPGHADYTYHKKYDHYDYRGGGRSSGRETIGRVAAGAIAKKILHLLGISVVAYTTSIGPIGISSFCKEDIEKNPFRMPDLDAAKQTEQFVKEQMKQLNSVGGVIECVVSNLPTGLGEPVFEKLDANLAKAIMSIGAVKGFEIGDGFLSTTQTGLEHNDGFFNDNGTIKKRTNHSGGVLGGISDGSPLILRAAIKPTPSIAALQKTVTKDLEEIDISIKGRHDPLIVPRAVVVIEAMTAITILDALLLNMTSQFDRVKQFYDK